MAALFSCALSLTIIPTQTKKGHQAAFWPIDKAPSVGYDSVQGVIA